METSQGEDVSENEGQKWITKNAKIEEDGPLFQIVQPSFLVLHIYNVRFLEWSAVPRWRTKTLGVTGSEQARNRTNEPTTYLYDGTWFRKRSRGFRRAFRGSALVGRDASRRCFLMGRTRQEEYWVTIVRVRRP